MAQKVSVSSLLLDETDKETAISNQLVDAYCANGADVHFTTATQPWMEHIASLNITMRIPPLSRIPQIYWSTAIPGALQFLDDRLNGVQWPKGCTSVDGI